MPTQLAQWNGKKKYGIKIIMANSNNNSIIPNLGRISLDTVFDFFQIAPENRDYFVEIMTDFVGMYSTIDW